MTSFVFNFGGARILVEVTYMMYDVEIMLKHYSYPCTCTCLIGLYAFLYCKSYLRDETYIIRFYKHNEPSWKTTITSPLGLLSCTIVVCMSPPPSPSCPS